MCMLMLVSCDQLFSVVLGVAGYILQAWSSQKANAAAVELAQKHAVSETRRQREHEQVGYDASSIVQP